MLNSSGQGFTIFKLLIGATIALAVLIIIISIIGFLENFKFEISQQRIFEQFNAAINTPNNAIVEVKDLSLKKDYVFSIATLATRSNISIDCIEDLTGHVQNSPSFISTDKTVTLKYAANVSIYYQCDRDDSDLDCPITCIVWFNKKPI